MTRDSRLKREAARPRSGLDPAGTKAAVPKAIAQIHPRLIALLEADIDASLSLRKNLRKSGYARPYKVAR